MQSNPLPPNEYHFFPKSYSEATKQRLKEFLVTDIYELQEEIMVRFRADKEMTNDLSKLRETPILEDGKQLFIQVALLDRGDNFAFATIIGPRDFIEANFDWLESARNAGEIGPEPGIYLPRQDS